MKIQIGVIGPEEKNIPQVLKNKFLETAREIGKIIAEKDVILITGGCSGVAEACAKEVYEKGGITVGTPGRMRGASIPYTTVEICTPIDIGDYIFAGVLSCDAIIVFPGDAGTLAELAIAYRYKKPLIFIKGFGETLLNDLFVSLTEDYPKFVVKDANEAVKLAIRLGKEKLVKIEEVKKLII